MPLPTSREQIRKLGERLASGGLVSDSDLRALEELVICHMTALELARPRLEGLAENIGVQAVHIAHRAKTTTTIIEKLRRQGGMSLARMQDLAGIRVVGDFGLADQDRLAAAIQRRFPADPRPAKIVDRRAMPSHGYRAVHVIVSVDEITIEIQIRTLMQHIWADLMERLADRLGRQIRYGEPPVPPAGMSQENAQAIVDGMMGMSAEWAAMEPAEPSDVGLYVDRITDRVWQSTSDALKRAGIDL